MEQLTHPHIRTGQIGEEIAARYLHMRGFSVIERNYREKWGEIDIVSRETGGKVHFVEVKTVSYETRSDLETAVRNRTWRPEENVDARKLKKLSRAIETWLVKNDCLEDWQIDVVAVRIVKNQKFATVKYIDNVIL